MKEEFNRTVNFMKHPGRFEIEIQFVLQTTRMSLHCFALQKMK